MPVTELRLPSSVDLPPPGSCVHLIGVGGAGMRGLALLLAHRGYRVRGTDRHAPVHASDLERAGIQLGEEADLEGLESVRLVIRSSAVAADHPQVVYAMQHGIPVLKRARIMGALVNDGRLAAVAGTHGKTTVTAMLAQACEAAGLSPTALVGGRVAEWDAYARLGSGDLAVVEADEYDRSFLELDPHLAVVTSVEEEHMEHYGTRGRLEAAFREFSGRAAGRLGLLACADDAGARAVSAATPNSRLYGFHSEADARVEVLSAESGVQRVRLSTPETRLEFLLGAPGRHNAQNAAAALVAALILGAEPARLRDSLAEFHGVDRRLQRLAETREIVVVDDYAHHPTEVRASLTAVRGAWPDRRLLAVFQPHLFSRTRLLAGDFAAALCVADLSLVLPIYGAREDPVPGVTASLITDQSGPTVRATSREAVLEEVASERERATAGEDSTGLVVLFMGAGDVTELAHALAHEVRPDAMGS